MAPTQVVCPRCKHESPPVARYCANCGLNLVEAGVQEPRSRQPRRRRSAGTWLVIGLLIIGLALAVFALLCRVKPERRIRMNLWHYDPPKHRMLDDDAHHSPRKAGKHDHH